MFSKKNRFLALSSIDGISDTITCVDQMTTITF